MSTTSHPTPDIEELLRAALTARAELVQPEDLAPLAPVVELRPRWRSPWVLLATAAVVLLVLGVVLQGLDSRPRSDRLAPKPDAPRLELPADVGRDWKPDDLSTPARLDLDGDGVKEKVELPGRADEELRRPDPAADDPEQRRGRRPTASPSSAPPSASPPSARSTPTATATRSWCSATTTRTRSAVAATRWSSTSATACWCRRRPRTPTCCVRGQVAGARGSRPSSTRWCAIHDYWIEDGGSCSSRSVNAYASGSMTLLRPESLRRRHLGVDARTTTGVLRRGGDRVPACSGPRRRAVRRRPGRRPPRRVTGRDRGRRHRGAGRRSTTATRSPRASRPTADPSLVVEGERRARPLEHGARGRAIPRVSTAQPSALSSPTARRSS